MIRNCFVAFEARLGRGLTEGHRSSQCTFAQYHNLQCSFACWRLNVNFGLFPQKSFGALDMLHRLSPDSGEQGSLLTDREQVSRTRVAGLLTFPLGLQPASSSARTTATLPSET